MTFPDVLEVFRAHRCEANIAGMARYGISTDNAYGLSAPLLRSIAKQAGRDHALARQLWGSGIREARLLACFVEDPALVTRGQMDRWVASFDSWDVCDGACIHLFRKTPYAHEKALAWTQRSGEFVRRAGFALVATLAVHDPASCDERFRMYLGLVEDAAADERHFVAKAVNWALRQIGKRSMTLHADAVASAVRIAALPGTASRWVARDALRELRDPATIARIKARKR